MTKKNTCYFTVKEIARICNISTARVYQYKKDFVKNKDFIKQHGRYMFTEYFLNEIKKRQNSYKEKTIVSKNKMLEPVELEFVKPIKKESKIKLFFKKMFKIS